MGKRKFKFTQLKNEERKKYRPKSHESTLNVSIPLKSGVSLHHKEYTPLEPLPVSIPLSVVPLSSVTSLRFRLNAVGALPAGTYVRCVLHGQYKIISTSHMLP